MTVFTSTLQNRSWRWFIKYIVCFLFICCLNLLTLQHATSNLRILLLLSFKNVAFLLSRFELKVSQNAQTKHSEQLNVIQQLCRTVKNNLNNLCYAREGNQRGVGSDQKTGSCYCALLQLSLHGPPAWRATNRPMDITAAFPFNRAPGIPCRAKQIKGSQALPTECKQVI